MNAYTSDMSEADRGKIAAMYGAVPEEPGDDYLSAYCGYFTRTSVLDVDDDTGRCRMREYDRVVDGEWGRGVWDFMAGFPPEEWGDDYLAWYVGAALEEEERMP